MSFHAGGRKPQPPAKPFRFSLWKRLLIATIGIVCTLGGIYKYRYGGFIGENWRHQPIYSTDLIALGAAVIVIALLPADWLEKLAKRIAS
jgi:hypothetical protein